MGTECNTQRKAHILILPIEEQGHFTVYVQLLHHLSLHDIRVTVCSTKARCQELADLQSKGAFTKLELHLEDIFSPAYANARPQEEGDLPRLWYYCGEMEIEFKPYMQRLLDAKDPNEKPTFLLADMFLGWVEDVAEKLNIPWYIQYTCSVWAPLSYLWRQGVKWMPDDIMTLPGISPFRIREFLPTAFDSLHRMRSTAGILCNSFEELEKGTVDAARAHLQKHLNSYGQVIKILPIGPTRHLPGNPTFPDAREANSCLEWLDSRAPSSVLYIAFGTQAKLVERTIMRIALALEDSEVPFLWALRLPQGAKDTNSILPRGFLERTKGRGQVETSFVPQDQILLHPSVGGFFSHCGWNSALESLYTGVPVIAHPFHGDQPLNTRLMVEVAKTAIAIPRSDDGTFSQNDIFESIRSLMCEEKGQELRKNSLRWKQVALAAQADGGSSNLNIRTFVQEIIDSAPR